MPTNKNAQLRYQVLDRCFSNQHRQYTIDDLVNAVNDALYDLYGTKVKIVEAEKKAYDEKEERKSKGALYFIHLSLFSHTIPFFTIFFSYP